MKKLLLLLFSLIMLVACGSEVTTIDNNEQSNEPEDTNEVVTEIISEQEHNIILIDNDDFRMTLLKSTHEQYENARAKDKIDMSLEIENKKNRTFTLFIDELKLDGVETISDRTFFDKNELEPSETVIIKLSTFTEEHLDDIELSFKEHIAGTLIYGDYERSRLKESFSEYIIEQ